MLMKRGNIAPGLQREQPKTSLAVNPRSGPHNFIAALRVLDIMDRVIFFTLTLAS